MQKVVEELKQLTVKLSSLKQQYPSDEKEIKKNKNALQDITNKISNFQVKLNQHSKKLKKIIGVENITIEDIASVLKHDETYLDFANTKYGYFLITINKNSYNFLRLPQTTMETIDFEMKQFINMNDKIVAKELVGTTQVDKLIPKSQKILTKLYDMILLRYLKHKTSLIISPDGLLNFLPFEALYHENKYLIETHSIHYTPSAREFIRGHKQKKLHNQPNKEVVVFAHPQYGEDTKPTTQVVAFNTKSSQTHKRRLVDIPYLAPLKGALEEIKILKKFDTNATVYQDANATVENLLKINSPKILHISTHGVFLDNNDSNPMQQSALAFAGTDRARMYKDSSGFATALKLSTLNLANTDLVVLSACDTGIGTINQAEGVVGLPKAFIQAGAQNIIMSLWKVSDRETTQLMQHFYDNLSQGMSYKKALREAKLKMINMHPYYWSSFVLSGS
ncbi:MAG: CHAT domain-containing protein [Campylobacterota bacterium]|nr:CHAT domain-containing protein [Campylobacterota bacterium]